MTGSISYRSDIKLTVQDFTDILRRSTLDARRPVNQPERIQRMLDHGNVLVTAWHGELLVGVSRALTDFAFCCYLSDLAVDRNFQHRGIGKELVRLTHDVAGKETQLILLAAPAAIGYYPKIGMSPFQHCFITNRLK